MAHATKALAEYARFTQDDVDHLVKKASVAALDKHGELALLAVNETGRGVFEDKAVKNIFACEHVTNSMANLKSVGIISRDDLTGITEIAEPVGVICGVTPVTNPTSTTIFKSLIALKTRNPIVFAFHPSAQASSVAAARVVRDAAVAAGAPEHCIQWVETPSIAATTALMNHPGVALILATGGNAMVRAAYSCGKPALGVGAGNVPAYIEKTAKLKRAVNDVVLSKAFDNGMVCASEQAVILDDVIYDAALAEFAVLHAYRANAKEKALLEYVHLRRQGQRQELRRGEAERVGRRPDARSGSREQAGFTVPDGHLDHPGRGQRRRPAGAADAREARARCWRSCAPSPPSTASTLAEQMVEFDGLGHSAAIHTQDDALTEEFGSRVKAVRIIANAPSSLGGIGDIYNAFIPSLTLGCGSYGHNSVSNNVSAVNLVNIKRIGRRNNNLQWFKVPAKTYFEPNAIRYLADMPDVERVTIVTDATMTTLGFVDKIIDVLEPPVEQGRAADHRPGRARAVREDRPGRRRADAPLPARHDHRARRRLADGRRQGHVAAVRAPGDPLLRPQAEVLRRPQARVQVPRAGRARAAGVHPDHVGHGRRGDAVRGHQRPGRRQEVPAGRLRADPVGRHHRPGPHRRRCRRRWRRTPASTPSRTPPRRTSASTPTTSPTAWRCRPCA